MESDSFTLCIGGELNIGMNVLSLRDLDYMYYFLMNGDNKDKLFTVRSLDNKYLFMIENDNLHVIVGDNELVGLSFQFEIRETKKQLTDAIHKISCNMYARLKVSTDPLNRNIVNHGITALQ